MKKTKNEASVTKAISEDTIAELRKKLNNIAEKHLLNSEEVLCISRKLDILILPEQKKLI